MAHQPNNTTCSDQSFIVNAFACRAWEQEEPEHISFLTEGTDDQKVTDSERKKVRKQLEDYCELDTIAMARIDYKLSLLTR